MASHDAALLWVLSDAHHGESVSNNVHVFELRLYCSTSLWVGVN